jgi:DNA-binding transcriptional regulator GbsR (MarR family)
MMCCDAKKKFINTWGQLGVNWGICRTMAQVHALLLISNKHLCADTIMEELDISRGNANMNIRALIEWGLVYRCPRQNGDRKEYFTAEKDISIVFKQIVKHRKKKELEPLLELLNQCDNAKEDCPDSAEFQRMVGELKIFSKKADLALDNLIKLENHWLSGTLMKMIK